MAGAFVASWVAGCATDRLDAAPPSGVNLTGDWQLNFNLSDDPDKLGPDPDTTAPQRAPGSHRGRGGGRGGPGGGGGMGMPPMGSPPDGGPPTSNRGYDPQRGGDGLDSQGQRDGYAQAGYGFVPVQFQESPPPPSGDGAPGAPAGKPTRGASINRLLRAPLTLSITQDKDSVTVKSNLPDGTQASDTYLSGVKTIIPFGKEDTADRTAGWRGSVFVVTTSARKFGTREDDFAIDADDGRLIMTTLTKGGKLGKVEITRVYDRVKR